MKKKKLFRALVTILLIVFQLLGLGFIIYALVLYKGVETFYRIFGTIILIYFFLLLSYLLLNSIKKKNTKSFVALIVFTLLIVGIEFTGFYYLNKIYVTLNSYNKDKNMYYSSLVSYDKTLKTYKDLNNNKIGIIEDENDIEGYVLPNEIIENLKLENNNFIIKYNSTMELLHALKNKEIDAAFFSSNYVDMFYTLEGYENIEEETVVLYETSKEYISNEDDIKSETSSLNKPFTMLLIGVDSSKDGVTSGYNADVLLLVTFNPSTLRATLTSIPRDMYLKTACSGNAYRRINTTTWGSSSSCAVKTIENLFDIDIDYYAKINFKGVVQLVDAVGGIDVDVPYSLCEQNSSRKWGENTQYIEKGKQHLNGEQALALARNRHSAKDSKKMQQYCPTYTEGVRNDYQRGKNQMKVIMGIVKAATKLTDPNQAVSILEKISSNFQTNVTTDDVLSLYSLAKSLVISDTTDLVNVQRLQLKGYNAWGTVYEPSSKSYPAVTIPYTGSITDIKNEMNINLGKSKYTLIKSISFDLNSPYESTIIGQGKYTQEKIKTMPNLSTYSVNEIRTFASDNNKTLQFVDVDTNQNVDIYDYSTYHFYSQSIHKDTILDMVSDIVIKVKMN
jgi:polyisoprenyl-teichoic acid--peptidoglycan teichoic acid transferase